MYFVIRQAGGYNGTKKAGKNKKQVNRIIESLGNRQQTTKGEENV